MKKNLVLCISILFSMELFAQSGNILFSDNAIHEIRFENIDTTIFFEFSNKGVYNLSKITIDGSIIDSIGIATKGNISWNYPNNKKPLKIKMNEFVNGKKYDGIKEFYLHNSYQDPSLMREKLTYDICGQMGLHTLRAAFAKVFINNVYWGVYTLIEAKDELYKRDFDNRNSEVFETFDFGTPCIYSQDPAFWAVDNGSPYSTWPRLQQLQNKLTTIPVSQYLDTIPKYFNISDFLKYQAVNVYLMNFDSYLQYSGNQLYLFDSVFENRFQIIPWDFNASFGLWNTASYTPSTLDIIPSLISGDCPFDKINVIPEMKATYLDAMCFLNVNFCDTSTLNNKITYLYNQIRSDVYSDFRKQPTNIQYDLATNYGYQIFATTSMDNVPGLKTFVVERSLKITSDLQNLPYSCSTMGIEQNSYNSIVIYPNPTKDIITIKSGSLGDGISIVNLLGQTVLSDKIMTQDNFTINISTLNNGLFILVITDYEGRITTRKILKE